MAGILYELFSFTTLITIGIYHIIQSTHHNLTSSSSSSQPKPFYLFSHTTKPHLRRLPLYLTSLSLLLSLSHHIFLSLTPDPLLKGSSPVHSFSSLSLSSTLFLFLLITLSLLFPLPIPTNLTFSITSLTFLIFASTLFSISRVQLSALEAKCDSVAGFIALGSAVFAGLIAVKWNAGAGAGGGGGGVGELLFLELGLGGSVCLQGFWSLQTGLVLSVDGFIPEGCHKLLDVVSGVEGSTKCELEVSQLRAVALLDFMFVVYVIVVVVIVVGVYLGVARWVGCVGNGGGIGGVGGRRLGSYEALPVVGGGGSGGSSGGEFNHVQMKTLSGTQE